MKKILLTLLAICLVPLARADNFLNEALLASPVLVTANPKNLIGGCLVNTAAAATYLHFYNAAATSSVTVGTTPQVFVVGVATGQSFCFGFSNNIMREFPAGIVVAATTTATSAGSTAPSAGLVVELRY